MQIKMYEWTKEDELELVAYEADLERGEFIAKNSGHIVVGAFMLAAVGMITLVILMV